jgi:argininosuccinate lyase
VSKLWGGRFTKQTDQLVEEYTASILFDKELAEEDIQGSLAHVTMLGKCGILPADDVEKIKDGLLAVQGMIRRGELEYSVSNEDIHMNIEKTLIDEIGPVGGKLHTGRSRNDQVATDMHLYLRKRVVEFVGLLIKLQEALLEQAKNNLDTIVPGYTHLQRAQPILFAHHLMAYVSMFQRDIERLQDSYKRINVLPLGAGALAGTTFMPQKKNPDVAELVRGKTGRVYGNLFGLMTVLKALPLAYNKDMQEDKEGMLDTVRTLQGALQLFAPMIASMKVNTERMRQAVNQDFSNATDIADYLVNKGLPFRQAHEVIGKIVLYCIQNKKYLLDMSMDEFGGFSDLFDDKIYVILEPEHVVNARNVYGGTASNQVSEAIGRAEVVLSQSSEWFADYLEKSK